MVIMTMSLKWSRVSSLQFSYWLGQAGIVHIGLDQRVLTAVSEIREKENNDNDDDDDNDNDNDNNTNDIVMTILVIR